MNNLRFKTKDLLNGVRVGGDYAGKNKVLPILGCIKFIIKKDRCNIVSSDEANAISYKCPILSFDEEVTFCIEKKGLENYLATLSDDTVTLDVNMGKMQCKVTAAKGHIMLPLEDVNCYPILATEKECKSFEMDASILQYWIAKCNNFIETDEFKLHKQSMNILTKDNELHVFASDEHRMFHDYCENPAGEDFSISIDRSAFTGLSKALKGEETVTIRNGESNLTFITSNSVILVRKREFKVPNFFSVLMYKSIFEVKVNRKEILESLTRAMGVSDDGKKISVILTFDKDKLDIRASSWDNNKSLEESLAIEGGDKLIIGFNAPLLYTCINNFSSEYIYIYLTGSQSLATIKADLDDNECTLAIPTLP